MTQKEFYLKWLEDWFRKKTEIPSDALCRNFFVEKWVDSFQTLELVLEIEGALNIILNDSALNDPRFSSLAGLSEILFELQDVNSSPIV